MPEDGLRKRSVTVQGHRTSVSLEPAFWQALQDAAREEGLSVNALIARIDERRRGNLSSAIRVWLLNRARTLPS
ncbi:MAG: aryl-sulfate sulfotransferase [Alphaproteobacteria bacterium]|nr:MAG: aryl-sulfate sulfotransferase [Alphaproteobacteria bacterium]